MTIFDIIRSKKIKEKITMLDIFYNTVEGDYNEVKSRLMNDRIILKFLLKFVDDPTYHDLMIAIRRENQEESFRAAHTLKGLCLNLGLRKLYHSVEVLTESLREHKEIDFGEYDTMVAKLKGDYDDVISAIQKL